MNRAATGLRLAGLTLLVLPPLAFWMPWEDCFPLSKWLTLATFGGLVLATTDRSWRDAAGAWIWLMPWTGWVVGATLTGSAITSATRGWMEAALLVLPPWAAIAVAGRIAGSRLAVALVVTATGMAVYAIIQRLGLEPGGWLSPFHKGVASTAGNPDLLGGALVLPFALAAAGWRDRPRAAGPAAAAILLGIAIIATEARAAWLGAALAAAMILSRGPWRRWAVGAGIGVITLAGVAATAPGAAVRWTSTAALTERLWTWRVALDILRDQAIRGTGPSSFRTVYLSAQAVRHDAGESYSHYTEYAHQEFLHLAVELGLVGLGLIIWGGLCAWRALRAHHRIHSAVRDGTAAGAVGVLVNALLSWPLHVPATVVPLWIMLAAGGEVRSSRPSANRFRVPLVLLLLPLLAIAFRPAYVSGVLRLGAALSAHGRFAEAGSWHDRAGRTGVAEFRLEWHAAVTARSRGDFAAAAGLADAAIRLEPGIAELRLERAAVAKAMRDFSVAESSLREAVRLDPGQIHAWNNLGNLLGELGRLVEAETAQRRAVALAPGSGEARRNLSVTLLRLGRRAEARAVLEGAP